MEKYSQIRTLQVTACRYPPRTHHFGGNEKRTDGEELSAVAGDGGAGQETVQQVDREEHSLWAELELPVHLDEPVYERAAHRGRHLRQRDIGWWIYYDVLQQLRTRLDGERQFMRDLVKLVEIRFPR